MPQAGSFLKTTAYNDKNLPYGERHAWNYVEIDGTYTATIKVDVQFGTSSTLTETAEVSIEVKPHTVPADSMTVSGGSGGAGNVFIYGDTVSVETAFTIPPAQAPDMQMTLFMEDASGNSSQISGPVNVDPDGKYRLSVDTAEKKLPVGSFDLVVRCVDQNADFSYDARAGVSLQQRIVTAVLSGDAGKAYDGTAALPQDEQTLGILSEGSYTFWYRFTPSSNNYSVITGSAVIRVVGTESGTEPAPGRTEGFQ